MSIVEARFRNLDGHKEVLQGSFTVLSLRPGILVDADVPFESWFLPGAVLIMTFVRTLEIYLNDLLEEMRAGARAAEEAPDYQPRSKYEIQNAVLTIKPILGYSLLERHKFIQKRVENYMYVIPSIPIFQQYVLVSSR